MNLMTSGVMNSLISAASQAQLARTPTAIYRQEADNLKPNQEVLDRAGGYANDTLESAREETEKASAELEKAQMEAAARKKAENAAKLEQAGTNSSDNTEISTGITTKPPVDTVEISEEGKIFLSQDAAAKTPQADAAGAPVETADVKATAAVPKAYVSSGAAVVLETAAPEHKLSAKG